MIKNIQGIKYQSEPYGEAFGGGIYSASCSIGFANSPTKISLSVVSEDSTYNISEADMDVTDSGAKTITIGGSIGPGGTVVNAVTFNRMYIFSYSFSNTPSSKTLTVNFVDHSLCLDKIFVGLIGRHGTRTTVDMGDGPEYNPANDAQLTAISQTWAFRLICEECNELIPSKILRPPSWKAPYDITRLTYIAGDGNPCPQPFRTYINVWQGPGSINGGYMLLGSEEFKDTECEIPKVSYTFEDLCNAVDWILGGDPHDCGQTGAPTFKHNLRDFERSKTYTAAYTGTLREVLSAWAADFSFDFTFDYESAGPEIIGIDLNTPVDLITVKNAIDTGFGPSSEKGLIRSHREIHTLENTYYQSVLVKYIKPPRPFSRVKQNYDAKLGKVLKVKDAIGTSANLGRSDDELYVSMALAKYSEETRLIWLSDLARTKSEDPYWCNPNQGDTAPDNNGVAFIAPGTPVVVPSAPQAWVGAGCADRLISPTNPWPPGKDGTNTTDPEFDASVHGDCTDSNYATKFDCEAHFNAAGNQKFTWHPNPNDMRLRKDTPWPALGFFPAISFNHPLNQGLGHNNGAAGIPASGYRDLTSATNRPMLSLKAHPAGNMLNRFDSRFLWDKRARGGNCVNGAGNPCEYLQEKYVDSDGFLLDIASVHGRDGARNISALLKCMDVEGNGSRNTVACPNCAQGNCYQYHASNQKAATDLLNRHSIAIKYGLNEDGNHPVFIDPEKYSVYLGIWNEMYQDKVGDFDKELANNFLGKYGYWYGNRTSAADIAVGYFNEGPINPPPNVRECPKNVFDLEGGQEHATYLYQFKVNTLPESKIYSGHSYPFASILRANGGFFAIPPFAIDTAPHCTYCPQRSVFEVADNAWGTPPDQVTAMIRNKFIIDMSEAPPFTKDPNVMSDLNLYIPKYKRISPTKDRGDFINIVGMEAFEESILEPEHMKSGYFPGIAVIPHMDKMFVPIAAGLCINDPGCNTCPGGLAANPAKPDCKGNNCAQYTTKSSCESNEGVWDLGVITRYDPVIKVDYAHWRCTEDQVAGVANSDCWPDSLVGPGIAYKGPDVGGAGQTCPNHWCHTGAGYCVGLDKDKDGVADIPQPSTNDPYPSMSAKDRCTDVFPVGYQGAWNGNIPFGSPTAGVDVCTSASGTLLPQFFDQASCVAGAPGPVPPNTWGPFTLGDGPAADGSLPANAAFQKLVPIVPGKPPKPEPMFPTDANSKYCTTDPSDNSYKHTCWGTYREDSEVFSALVFSNFTRRENESLIGKPSECILYCEEDIKSEVCASECPEEDEPIHGFQSYAARYLEITHMSDRVAILFPLEHIYTGFWYSDQLDKGTIMNKQIVMGNPPEPQELKDRNVMGTRIIDFDATPDLDALESTAAGKFQEQVVVTNNTLTPPQSEVVSLPQYYVFLLGTSQSADKPGEQIEIKVDGTEFDALTPYLTPEYGLTTFNIGLDGEGVSASLSFRSRPKKLPKREVLMQKIGPQALQGRIPKPAKNIANFRATQANQRMP